MQLTHKEANEIIEEHIDIIGYNAKRIREEKGFSEKQLGEYINSTYQIIRRLETIKGTNFKGVTAGVSAGIPQLPTLIKISKVCNVCVTEFFKPIPYNE